MAPGHAEGLSALGVAAGFGHVRAWCCSQLPSAFLWCSLAWRADVGKCHALMSAGIHLPGLPFCSPSLFPLHIQIRFHVIVLNQTGRAGRGSTGCTVMAETSGGMP